MKIRLLGCLAFVLSFAAAPAIAHHYSFAAYDVNKTVGLTGTVAKVASMNPHAGFYLDVRDDAGKVSNWEFELGSPNGLMRQGWTRDSVKIDVVISVRGSMVRYRSYLATARKVKLSDGRGLFAGPALESGGHDKIAQQVKA